MKYNDVKSVMSSSTNRRLVFPDFKLPGLVRNTCSPLKYLGHVKFDLKFDAMTNTLTDG